jgi:hypothetical protein
MKNFADNLIERYFEENKLEDDEFLPKLESTIKSSQVKVSGLLEKLLKENEQNALIANNTKEEYFHKLDCITGLYNNFESRVDLLNKHYADKLSYISVLSKSLGNFERFDSNIKFANKIFEHITRLNSSEDVNAVLPDIFKDPDLMLEEGVEVFEAFRQLVDVASRDYPVFVKNFKVIEAKMKECLQDSIKNFYEQDELNKLEKLMGITEIYHSDFIIEMYVNYVIDSMNLNFIIKSLKNISYDHMGNEMFSHVFKIIDEFYENIIRGVMVQYGYQASKIYLIFPERKQKIVIGILVNNLSKKIDEFRRILISEKDKSEEVYVKIIEYIYPQSQKFVFSFRDTLNFSKTDLWNNIQQETSIFLREIESVYMNKERNILRNFLSKNFESKTKEAVNIKRSYESKQMNIEQFQNELFDLIMSTNFLVINKFTMESIGRYGTLIGNKEEQIDLVDTLCKSILDTVKTLLETYCNIIKTVYVEREKNNCTLSEPQYFILGRLNHLVDEFNRVFMFDLRDLFKRINFFDTIDDVLKKRINLLKNILDQTYLQLSTYTSSNMNIILKQIKYKETYNVSKVVNDYMISNEVEKVSNFLRPIFITVSFLFNEFRSQKTGQIIIKRKSSSW